MFVFNFLYITLFLFNFDIVVANKRKDKTITLSKFIDTCFDKDHLSTSLMGCILCNTLSLQNNKVLSVRKKIFKRLGLGNNTEVFNKVYSSKIWGNEGGGSGTGSDPDYAASTIHVLRLIIYKYGITRLLDAPCGGVSDSWMRYCLSAISEDLPCFKYHGVDVVSSVINKNIEQFKNASNWVSFTIMDITSGLEDLPIGYDMILSRDALQHQSYQNIANAIATYCRSDAKYLLIGSYNENTENKDIVPGDVFAINILIHPFLFPQPIETFVERGRAHEKAPKFLLLYRLDSFCNSINISTFLTKFR